MSKEVKIYEKLAKKKEVYLTLFVLLSLYLSLLESFIPKPFPWMKLGLANIITIFVMEKFGFRMAAETSLLRIFIQSLTLGTLLSPGFIISGLSGITSVFAMGFLFRFRENLSLIAISSFSAMIHNLMQLIVVYFLLYRNVSVYSRGVLILIMTFLLAGIVSGGITGFICEKIKIRKVDLKK
ncbi:Gx transporter family protein [Fusobacterium sp. PH5-44]|uniref:Gx transporter family protein n=1 Tax=unclassified Fusobacterium TaxID=2648384 RepID=UPI003D1F0DC6